MNLKWCRTLDSNQYFERFECPPSAIGVLRHMYRICGRPIREQHHSTFSRSGREKRSVKTHHPLWNEYTLRPLTQRSTSADTLPIALISFLVHLRKHRASFNVGADLLSLSAGLECRTRTYNFLLVRETRFHCVNSRYVKEGELSFILLT